MGYKEILTRHLSIAKYQILSVKTMHAYGDYLQLHKVVFANKTIYFSYDPSIVRLSKFTKISQIKAIRPICGNRYLYKAELLNDTVYFIRDSHYDLYPFTSLADAQKAWAEKTEDMYLYIKEVPCTYGRDEYCPGVVFCDNGRPLKTLYRSNICGKGFDEVVKKTKRYAKKLHLPIKVARGYANCKEVADITSDLDKAGPFGCFLAVAKWAVDFQNSN